MHKSSYSEEINKKFDLENELNRIKQNLAESPLRSSKIHLYNELL